MTQGGKAPSAGPALRVLLGSGVVLVVIVAVAAILESRLGIKPVAETLRAVVVAMVPLLGLAGSLSLAFRKRGWRVYVVAPVTGMLVVLSAFSGYIVNQGHAASAGFAVDVARFPTPAGFTYDATASTFYRPGPGQTEYVAREWKDSGSSSRPCDAVKVAFKNWNGGPARSAFNDERCVLESHEAYRNVRLELDGDGVLKLEMWLEKS